MAIFFEHAKNNPYVRQKFLEEIDFERYNSFVKDILYFKGEIGDRIMETIPDDSANWIPNTTSTIKVSDYAFDRYSLDEFYNILIYHEGFHALQNYFEYASPIGRSKKVNLQDDTVTILYEKNARQEKEAYQNQINHPTFSKCSKKFQKLTLEWLVFYENLFKG